MPLAIIAAAELGTSQLALQGYKYMGRYASKAINNKYINVPAMAGEYASQLIKHDGDWHAAAMNFNFTSAIPGGPMWGKAANVAAGTIFERSSLKDGLITYKDGLAGYTGRTIAGTLIQFGAHEFGTIGGSALGNSYGNYINILTAYGQKHTNVK
ncbi:hypothetical protein [Saccharicrinis aurantiacus]|uniref:hypothetical protein n=1 Tax=Saccharicrinis aurantiacus TaxID=1849719 RepID=UPI000838509F|nr:hypothetical protein [Saccharicrinis aurantiacus]